MARTSGSSDEHKVNKGNKGKKAVRGIFKLFHGIVCFLLFAGGAALLGYSIYVTVTGGSTFPDLPYTDGSTTLRTALKAEIAGIVVGAAVMFVAILGFFSFSRGCCGIFMASLFTVLMLALLAVLIFVAVVSFKIVRQGNVASLESDSRAAWERAMTDPQYTDNLCQIQQDYNCRGFDDGDCAVQGNMCPTCPDSNTNVMTGCFNAVINEYQKVYRPAGIVSSAMGGLVLLDLLVVWLF
eukprot:Plantae.Rhodophyta-Purpureofilum_apyrenoidigerum.ctg2902.p1 GENE.Plantae.Rhodophyta-Purpureofilum_apyrenoidigerum.ctg2902~~Plantae.Rhodophyta-Purpureofilum_apyrenoidigerum.ctg2902.p1  ORF type:complete len:239 (+),score=43.90 Plantae.Rhodophyta-Purpureofilum_apyrenoidigerum.ctg2902:187-903(+)